LEACMSTAQMALGIGLGLTQFTAALDVFKLMENNSAGDKRHIIAEEFWAIPMFVIMLSLTIMEYLYRHKIYNWCQAMLLRFRMTPHNSNKIKTD